MANTKLRKIAAIAFVNAIACADECVVTLAQSQGYTDVLFGSEHITFPLQIMDMVQSYDKDRDHAAFGSAPYSRTSRLQPPTRPKQQLGGLGRAGIARCMCLLNIGRNFIAQEQQLDNAFAFAEKLKSMANQERENNSRPMPPNTVKYFPATNMKS